MWFTCLCPYCGTTLRLLRKLADYKVMCPDCRKPFIAQEAEAEADAGAGERSFPGWNVVCASCGHTEWVVDSLERRIHCPRCDSELPQPTADSQSLGRKKKRRRRDG